MIRGIGKSRTKPATGKQRPEDEITLPGDAEATEEVVLSADDASTPAGAVVGNADAAGDTDPAAAHAAANPKKAKFDLVPQLLAAIRIPEHYLILGYKNSGAREFLLKNVSWYKDFEDNQIMGRTLEAAYGGASNRRYRLQRFVRDNLLFSLLLCAAALYSGQLIVHSTTGLGPRPDLMKIVQPPTKPKPKLTAADSGPKPEDRVRQAITSTLDHCSVDPDARSVLLAQLGDSSEFRDVELNQAMREFRRFQTRYQAIGLTKWYREAREKRAIIGEAMTTVLPHIESFLAAQKDERQRIYLQLKAKENQFAQVQERSPRRGVTHVNEWIRIRDQLKGLREQLQEGPSEDSLRALEDQLGSARQILAAKAPLAQRSATTDAAWTVETQTMDAAAIRKLVAEAVQDIDSLLSIPAPVTAKLNNYRVQNVRSHLQTLAEVLHVNKGAPHALLRSLKQTQEIANGRLEQLLSKLTQTTATPINYTNCVTTSS